ncbi:hypothetical protein GQX74_015193 [Glossina fuscipes]|nr:hypothetical protein GQX74_015193 [Glossina fuscipes]
MRKNSKTKEFVHMRLDDILDDVCGFLVVICAAFILNVFEDLDITLNDVHSIMHPKMQEINQYDEEILVTQNLKEARYSYGSTFGTTLPRLVLPRSGPRLFSFMPAHQGDDPLSPGPAAYMVKTTYKDALASLCWQVLGSSMLSRSILSARTFKIDADGSGKRQPSVPNIRNQFARISGIEQFFTPPKIS